MSCGTAGNLPAPATAADVSEVFQMSYDLRCKAVTVCRNGCRPERPVEAMGE
jgi:ribonucleotide reductase alpha subunit